MTVWLVRTRDGIRLAVRYDMMAAVETAEDFKHRWPLAVVVEGPFPSTACWPPR